MRDIQSIQHYYRNELARIAMCENLEACKKIANEALEQKRVYSFEEAVEENDVLWDMYRLDEASILYFLKYKGEWFYYSTANKYCFDHYYNGECNECKYDSLEQAYADLQTIRKEYDVSST